MSSDNTGWSPPSGSGGSEDAPAPRFGAYGQAPAGQSDTGHASGPDYDTYPPSGAAPGGGAPDGFPAPGGPSPQGQYAQQAQAFGTPAPGGFVLAPKPGIIPLRPLDVLEIITGAFESLRANPRAMFVPALAVMSIIGALSGLLTYVTIRTKFNAAGTFYSDTWETTTDSDAAMAPMVTIIPTLVTAVLAALATSVLTGLLIVAVSRSVLGRVATPGEVWARTKSRVWALVGQSLLVSLISSLAGVVMLGGFAVLAMSLFATGGPSSDGALVLGLIVMFIMLIASVILAAFFWVRLSLSGAALILENVGVVAGIKRSWQLTRGSFWRVLGVLLLAVVITSAVNGILSTGIGVVGGVTAAVSPDLYAVSLALTNFVSSLLSAIVLPFSAAVTALLYVDLRMRHEGLDVELRRAAGV